MYRLGRARLLGKACYLPTTRRASSLPQIPGTILVNAEIPEDGLIKRIRRWASASEALRASTFDLLQMCESQDGKLVPRAVLGLLRTQIRLAGSEAPVRALVGLFYRSRDALNREFWEDQARRLCDVVADEHLTGHRAVQVLVHHSAPAWSMGLEMGEHRVLADFGVLHIVGRPGQARREAEVVRLPDSDPGEPEASSHADFHKFCLPSEGPDGGALRGRYVVRSGTGPAVCGLRVLGTLPLRVVCSSAWIAEGHDSEFAALVAALQRRSRRRICSIVGDRRDPHWQGLANERGDALFGRWHVRRPLGVTLTGVPVNLEEAEQARLAQAPWLVPWEVLPFHAGQVLLT